MVFMIIKNSGLKKNNHMKNYLIKLLGGYTYLEMLKTRERAEERGATNLYQKLRREKRIKL